MAGSNPPSPWNLSGVCSSLREGRRQETIPYAAGCQTIGIYPYCEARRDRPQAVVGRTDISARPDVRQQLGDNLMTVAVTMDMLHEMEANASGSFLERPVWRKLAEGKGS